jgi:formylmethanofuran dehydrogenase subunit E
VTEESKQLRTQITDAVELHGHLGPFLVIGVRIGRAAKQILNSENQGKGELYASVEVPLQTPFSCILDGVQSITHCTIGNQRLRVEKSRRNITARFETTESDKTLAIVVNPEIVKEVTDKISKGATNETLAEAIASMPENKLLKLNITEKHSLKKR